MRNANQAQEGANNVIVNVAGPQPKGHSIIFWLLLSCFGIGIPFLLYFTVSSNHRWHL